MHIYIIITQKIIIIKNGEKNSVKKAGRLLEMWQVDAKEQPTETRESMQTLWDYKKYQATWSPMSVMSEVVPILH